MEPDRFTRLDRVLIAEQEAANEFADLRPDHDTLETMKRNRALLIARAGRLEKMGLATEVRPGEWHISDRAEGTLRALGEREDIIKSVHRALEGNDLNDARGTSQLAVHRYIHINTVPNLLSSSFTISATDEREKPRNCGLRQADQPLP